MKKINDLNFIVKYYDESERKSQRRIKLLNLLFEHIVVNRNYNDNMSEICRAINTERKTVYRYYENREAIMLELRILVYIRRNLMFKKEIEKIMQIEEISVVEKFYIILDINVELLLKHQFDLLFTEYSKQLFAHTDQKSLIYIKYKEMMSEQNFNHYLPILNELETADLLRNSISAKEYASVIDESLRAYIFQTMDNKDNCLNDNDMQIERFVNLLKQAIIDD